MSAALTKPIKWHGGKQYLAKRILAEMPPRCKNPNKPASNDSGWLHYVEPYFGGGSVLLAQDPDGISEVVNDLNRGLINFWKVLRDESLFERFKRANDSMPFSKEDYDKASAICGTAAFNASSDQGKVLLALDFFVACRQSMAGRMDCFAPLTRNRTRRGMNEQASAWLNAIEGLPAVHERLKRVVILNDHALTVIKQQDGPRTFFYLDPPYVHGTRETTGEYAHEMTDQDHADLLALLQTIEGRFILSGYPNDLYNQHAEAFGWRRVDIKIDNKASSKKSKDKETECLWMNYS